MIIPSIKNHEMFRAIVVLSSRSHGTKARVTNFFFDRVNGFAPILDPNGDPLPGASLPPLIISASTSGQYVQDVMLGSDPAWGIYYSARMRHMGTNSEMKTKLNFLAGGTHSLVMESEPVPQLSAVTWMCFMTIPVPGCTAHEENTQTRLFAPLPALCGSSALLTTVHKSWIFIRTDKPLPFPPQQHETYDNPSSQSLQCTPPPGSGGAGGSGNPEGYTLYTYTNCQYEAVYDRYGNYLYTENLGCSTTQFTVPKGTIYEI